jgi:hypothetical protein
MRDNDKDLQSHLLNAHGTADRSESTGPGGPIKPVYLWMAGSVPRKKGWRAVPARATAGGPLRRLLSLVGL